MSLPATLATFGALGLAGSLHCAGMCGGFAVAVASTGGARRRALLVRELVFVLGKALSYAVLATGLALLGRGAAAWGGVELARRAAAWLAGAALVLAGLALAGFPALHLRLAPALRARLAGVAAAWRSVLDLPGTIGPLGAGLLVGWLPCGLSWSALLLALSVAPGTAAAGAFLFGLGTAPALLAVGLGWGFFAPATRVRLARLLAPLLVAFGLLTVARGGLPGLREEAVLPECCAPAATEAGLSSGH